MFKSIFAPAAVVSVFWILMSIASTYMVGRLIDSNTRSLEEDVTTIESAWALRRDVWRIQSAVLETTQPESAESPGEFNGLVKDFQATLKEARRTSLTAKEQASAGAIGRTFETYVGEAHGIMAGEHGAEGLTAAEKAHFENSARGVADACLQLSEANEALIRAASASNRRLYVFLTLARFTTLIIGPAMGLVLGLWLSRRMQRSVSQISASLNDAGGALHEKIADDTGPADELQNLGYKANRIAARVQGVVHELDRTRQQVIQGERLAAVGELAAGIAHEIRNPLTSIKLLIQNAARQEHPGRAMNGKQLEVVLQEISRMESLVQDLLNFARPPRLKMIRHDVRQTVRRALNLVSGRALQRQNRIVEEIADDPIMLTGDPEQLLMIFLNLAINGLEAMREGSLIVTVRGAEGLCRIVFRDQGAGIAADVLERVFEPFVTTKERGVGLGLAICQRIVRQHQGTLRAENDPAGGALLTVELPLNQEPEPAEATVPGAGATDSHTELQVQSTTG